jgi:hypothetical protein
MRARFDHIPPGESGTDETVRRLGALIKSANQRPKLHILATHILSQKNVPAKNDLAAARALWSWIRQNIRFVKDPTNVELIQDPELTAFQIRAGDCDDHAALMAALAASIGIPARLSVIGNDPQNFQHIFAEVQVGGKWIAADTTIKEPFGTRPKLAAVKRYSLYGVPQMSLGVMPTQVVPVTKKTAKQVAYRAALDVLRSNWNKGIINLQDVLSYVRVIDEGNAEFRGTIYEAPMRKAISDFAANIKNKGLQSGKPASSLSGMEGLDGFLKSVWNGVKSAVGAVVGTGIKLATGAVGAAIQTFTGATKQAETVFVQAATTPTAQGGAVPTAQYYANTKDNTLLYVGLGVAALVLVMVMR